MPRLVWAVTMLTPPTEGTTPEVVSARWGSPVTGSSILMTEAPKSARTPAAAGANVHWATSSTWTPSNMGGDSAVSSGVPGAGVVGMAVAPPL